MREDQYLEVRYEQLLREPDSEMRRIFTFLGETPPEGPIKLNRPSIKVLRPGLNVSQSELVQTNADAWRSRMKPVEIRRVESVAWDLMEELGYEPLGPRRPSPPIRAGLWRAQSLIRHYTRMFRRLDKVRDNLILLLGRFRWSPGRPDEVRGNAEGR